MRSCFTVERVVWTSNESFADASFIKPDDYESSADDGFAERLMWLWGRRLLIIPCKSGGDHSSDWNRLDWPSVWSAWLPECILGVMMLLCVMGSCFANQVILTLSLPVFFKKTCQLLPAFLIIFTKISEKKEQILCFETTIKKLYSSFMHSFLSTLELMYRCSLIPYAIRSALRTEHVRSLRNGISLKMAKYPVKSTSQSTYGRLERT
ncbi:hypothetical protein DPX16_21507 [Anabarilius grahami]|uniref:Uncharacterized protein n=1 Tax=Anabarilius grahami TaxID=495550 RepID=A0A3N0XWL9_ANAGA|nr:hypothetical protein DPX16_21507 [Anabarilius grahami]